MKAALFAIMPLVILMSGCVAQAPLGYASHSDPFYGFSLQYPMGWKELSSGGLTALYDFIVTDPGESSIIGVIMASIPEGADMEYWVEEFNYNVVSQDAVIIRPGRTERIGQHEWYSACIDVPLYEDVGWETRFCYYTTICDGLFATILFGGEMVAGEQTATERNVVGSFRC
jgi:hypothetical protein